jgi:hypothetical protein
MSFHVVYGAIPPDVSSTPSIFSGLAAETFLSPDETSRTIEGTTNLMHRTILMVLYRPVSKSGQSREKHELNYR